MSYIVKNCPNYFKTHSGDYCDLDTGCCLYRTDCLIKQVIEKANREMNYEEPDMCEILELFEIKECE